MDEHAGPAWALWLEHSALGEFARHSWWLYPLCGVVHLIGLGLLVGSILAVDLRLLGVARRLDLSGAAPQLLTTAVIGFCLSVATGFTMFTADAPHLLRNPVFLAKLCVIVLAGLNAGLFHLRAARAVIGGWADEAARCHARWAGGVSLGLWLSVVSLGRLIAYF
jgi:hypothetical protein